MTRPALTYENAHTAGWDAGNRSMRAAGRSVWNEDDWCTACAAMSRLSPRDRWRPIYAVHRPRNPLARQPGKRKAVTT